MSKNQWRFILIVFLVVAFAGLVWSSVLAARGQLRCSSKADQTPMSDPGLSSSTDTRIFLPFVDRGRSQVYTVAENGSDSVGDGSAISPWATITHALEKVPDGALILVLPGTYTGQVELHRSFKQGVTVRSAVPYQARMRNNGQVFALFFGEGLTLEGFDIAHSGPGADRYVIQIQDAEGDGSGGKRITFRNNIIHDSYHDDLLKVNNGAQEITIQGNVFYNMGGPGTESHIDINSVTNVMVEDNIFFNDFEGSNRPNLNDTGHYIVVKDSNGADDGIKGSQNITLRRNIFLNWEGGVGSAFIGIGDGKDIPFYQASHVMIENNLFLGNSPNKIHAALKITSGDAITFRNNTVVGDLPGNTFAFRLDLAESGLVNKDINFYNNIWSDPTGTMGANAPLAITSFSDTPNGTVGSYQIFNNLYWNGGQLIPINPNDQVNYTNDQNAVIGDPLIANMPQTIKLPRWNPADNKFQDGSATIRQAFESLVERYGVIAPGSPALDAAAAADAPQEDILDRPRPDGKALDIGAYEIPLPVK